MMLTVRWRKPDGCDSGSDDTVLRQASSRPLRLWANPPRRLATNRNNATPAGGLSGKKSHGRPHPHRRFGLALHALARELLSEKAPAVARTAVRGANFFLDRAQWLVLFAPAPFQLCAVVRADSTRIRVRDQGQPLHHAHAQVAGHRSGPRELSGIGSLRTRRQAGALPLAVPAGDALPCGGVRGFLFNPATHQGTGDVDRV